MKRLSVVIVTYNSEKDIFDCVASLEKHADLPRGEMELVVVDNNSRSPDAMFERLRRQWGDDIVEVESPVNGGYGRGNNIGIKKASAPVALVMNPDVRLFEPVLSEGLDSFDRNPSLALLGMVQMFSPSKRSNRSVYPTWLVNGWLRLLLYGVCNRADLYLPSCRFVQGSCFFVRLDMFLAAGGFDGDNFMYGEEEDLHWRLKKLFGSRCMAFNRKLRYIHLAGERRTSAGYEKKLFEANAAMYARKGVSPGLILRHFLQSNRLLLWKKRFFGGGDRAALEDFREYLIAKRGEYESENKTKEAEKR